jgi:predicted ATPase
MFSRVELQQVRSHASTSISLAPLTVFVGANATGKSTVLGMIERTCARLRAAVDAQSSAHGGQFVDGYAYDALVRRGAEEFSCKLFRGAQDVPEVRISAARDAQRAWRFEGTIFDAPTSDWIDGPRRSRLAGLVSSARSMLSTVLLALDPTRIAQKVTLSTSGDAVVGDGGLAAVALLQLAQRRDKTAYEAVVAGMRALVPCLLNVRAVVSTGAAAGVQLVYDFEDADDIAATSVSEGTLLATALLIALHSDDQPRVLLLDDIERGLHPTAQIRFAKQLTALLAAQPELQIVATTHSPFILDALKPSQVRAFARRKDGSVAVKSLAEHPMASDNQGALTTGQLWSLDDEASWVLSTEERAP